jgi:hypothetical protein
MSFFVRTSRPEEWQLKLAEPNKQWKRGHSAKALAYCWMEARGFPQSVKRVFQKSKYNIFKEIEFLAGFVEHQVPLPPIGAQPSQNDVFVLAKNKKDLIAIAVEGKVLESFGELVRDWQKDEAKGKKIRLKFLGDLLQLDQSHLQEIRYQLLHRTASALIEAKLFNASTALMLVHSFSPNHDWFGDYSNFASLFGIKARLNTIHFAKRLDEVNLYLAWITGEKAYLKK